MRRSIGWWAVHAPFRTLIIAVVGAIAGFSGCADQMPSDAEGLYQKGVRELRAWNYRAADSTFAILRQKFPESDRGLLGRAMTKEAQLLHYDALDDYLRLEAQQTRPRELAPRLARLYLKLGDYEQAWRALSDYIPGNSKDIDALIDYAEGLLAVSRYSQARQAVDIALRGGLGSTDGAILMARIFFLQRKFDSSAASLAQARQSPITSARSLTQLARYYEMTEQYDSAVALGLRAVEAAPGELDVIHEQFLRALRSGYLTDARTILKGVDGRDKDSMVIHGLRMFYYWATGDSYRANQHDDRYFAAAAEELTGFFYDIESRWMYSDLISCNSNIDAINALLARRKSTDKMGAYLRGRLVLAYSRIFEPQTDIASLRAAPGYASDQIEYRMMEATHLAMSKQSELLTETLDLLDQYRGEDPTWAAGIGSVYAGRWMQDFATGGRYYEKALARDSVHRAAFEGLLQTRLALFGLDSGLALLQRRADITQLYPTIAMTKAMTLLSLGRADEAWEQFSASLDPIAGRLDLYLHFSSLAGGGGRADLAQRALELMVTRNPQNPDAFAYAARAANNRSDFVAGLQLAEEALSLEPDFPPARTEKARSLVGTGDFTNGFAQFDAILKEADGDIEANLYYSAALAYDSTNTTNMIKAGNLARHAHFLDRASLRSLLNLCYVYGRSGKYDGVRAEAAKAVNAYPGSPEAHYYLGMAMLRLKEKQGSDLLTHAIKLGLSGALRQSADSLLAKG